MKQISKVVVLVLASALAGAANAAFVMVRPMVVSRPVVTSPRPAVAAPKPATPAAKPAIHEETYVHPVTPVIIPPASRTTHITCDEEAKKLGKCKK